MAYFAPHNFIQNISLGQIQLVIYVHSTTLKPDHRVPARRKTCRIQQDEFNTKTEGEIIQLYLRASLPDGKDMVKLQLPLILY